MINLEPICARYGHRMIEGDGSISMSDQENTITKALGVLLESGLYAMCIFLLSCNKKRYGEQVLKKHLVALWKEPGIEILAETISKDSSISDILTGVQQTTESLPLLILTRKVTEQTLTFARYHAKAEVSAPI